MRVVCNNEIRNELHSHLFWLVPARIGDLASGIDNFIFPMAARRHSQDEEIARMIALEMPTR
jgi:hypothetical protein